ncbi:hypothetical protein CWC48_22145 [Pseudomonas sp. S10E 269]|nr:hypothetical protein CWC49_02595 [Pseudomonas sp. S09F 262]PJK41721.1 hypothetical protein CWC48_22145 [Pseudomonas sp. S10E 269]
MPRQNGRPAPAGLIPLFEGTTHQNVGAGLLAKAVFQSMHSVTDTPHSRASPLSPFLHFK